jgi:hypothetical protein
VMFDSDQGTKVHQDCVPDYAITDLRDLLKILDLPNQRRGDGRQDADKSKRSSHGDILPLSERVGINPSREGARNGRLTIT